MENNILHDQLRAKAISFPYILIPITVGQACFPTKKEISKIISGPVFESFLNATNQREDTRAFSSATSNPGV